MNSTLVASHARRVQVYQWSMYGGLFVLTGVSLGLFVAAFFGYAPTVWQAYVQMYLHIALLHTWFMMLLLFVTDLRKRTYRISTIERIAVIIPCFNESIELLEQCIRSIRAARGSSHIILIDDGSTNGTRSAMRALAKEYGITFRAFRKNKGKRYALYTAVQELIGDCRYVVMVDSDTVVERDALVRLTAPLRTGDCAATSGDVRLINEDQNVLTRMIGAYYWMALNIHRRSQSSLGMVSCCSGALSGYRADVLRSVMDEFIQETFLGSPCTHSEDRHLTNLVLRKGYNVLFVPEALCYTRTPATFVQFWKQQQRWRRGFLIEAIFSLSYAWRTKPMLFLEYAVWEVALPFLSLGIIIATLITIATDPLYFLFYLLPSWMFLLFIRSLPLIFRAREKLPGLFLFMLCSTFLLYWQTFIALVTLQNRKWVTR